MYFHLYLKVGDFFHIPQFLRKCFFGYFQSFISKCHIHTENLPPKTADFISTICGLEEKNWVSNIFLRAARSYLCLPKNATSVGVLSEINWIEPVYRTQVRMVRQLLRVTNMQNSRLSWDKTISEQFVFQTWYKEVKTIVETRNMLAFFGHAMNSLYKLRNYSQVIL